MDKNSDNDNKNSDSNSKNISETCILSEIGSSQIEIDKIKFQKMCFLFNALESGWSIKKRSESYIFTKNHENKKEVFDESYLSIFMKDNININNLLS
jgi:hypothetical protein